MGRGEAAWWKDKWGVGDEGRNLSELIDMGRGEEGGQEPNIRTRGTMKWGVQRWCLLPMWWR